MNELHQSWADKALRRMSRQAGGAAGLLGAFAERSHDAIFVVDTERNVLAFNARAEELTGVSRSQVLGRHCLNGFKCGTCLESCGVFQHGEVADVPVEIFRSDGQRLSVLKSASVVRDKDGKVIGAVEIFRPTDGVGDSADGPSAWSGMEGMMASLGRGAIVVDAEFQVVRASSLVGEWVGRSSDALVGAPVSSLLGDSLVGPGAYFRAALESGERREGWRASIERADGSRLAVSVTGAVFAPGSGCRMVSSGRYYLIVLRPEPQVGADEGASGAVSFEGMVARSQVMQRVFHLVEHLRESDATVLITGESGTGKELVARAIHSRSLRAGRPFLAVNCGALPENLLETELFGHARGAFTGAVRDKLGRFEAAGDGTVFLDEVGDLPLPLQVKLLRVLQERTFERVGETLTRPFRARVVAATHQNLAKAVAEKRFREDLFYRLNVVPIALPSLRERREDLELLIVHLLERVGQRTRALRLSPSAMRALLSFDWPGNVRQLENALEYATAVCEGQTIHREDLPPEVLSEVGNSVESATPEAAPVDVGSHEVEPEVELGSWPSRSEIVSALSRTRHRRGAAAKLLGVSRTTLWRRMTELGLT